MSNFIVWACIPIVSYISMSSIHRAFDKESLQNISSKNGFNTELDLNGLLSHILAQFNCLKI